MIYYNPVSASHEELLHLKNLGMPEESSNSIENITEHGLDPIRIMRASVGAKWFVLPDDNNARLRNGLFPRWDTSFKDKFSKSKSGYQLLIMVMETILPDTNDGV